MTRRRTLGVLAVAVLVLLAGCSGAVSDGPTATDQQTSATTEATNTTTTTTETPNGTLSVHFINVGQGSSILVVSPANETILIDTGLVDVADRLLHSRILRRV